jgi:hypothetical protein
MILAIVGTITGTCSLIGIIIGFTSRFAKLEDKVDLLWEVWVEIPLKKVAEGRVVSKMSNYVTTEIGDAMLPDVLKSRLRTISHKKKPKDLFEAGVLINKEIGLKQIKESIPEGYSIQEMLLIASGYVLKGHKKQLKSR